MARYRLRINGAEQEVESSPRTPLLNVIREQLGLTGTKYGCGEGACGACTVLIDGQPTRSCMTPVASVAKKEIRTIESLASGDRLHPVQEAFLEEEALQCGYCTSGMIMAVVGLLERNPNPGPEETRVAMNGNICRCGTYPRILRAIQRVADRSSQTEGRRR